MSKIRNTGGGAVPGTVAPILVQLLLCAIFLTAAIAKCRDFGSFQASVIASLLIPYALVPAFSVFLISIEFLVAVGLLIPATRSYAARGCVVLASVFLAYAAWRWIEGVAVPCHCFGILFRMSPLQAALLNLCLLALSTYLVATLPGTRRQTTAGHLPLSEGVKP